MLLATEQYSRTNHKPEKLKNVIKPKQHRILYNHFKIHTAFVKFSIVGRNDKALLEVTNTDKTIFVYFV